MSDPVVASSARVLVPAVPPAESAVIVPPVTSIFPPETVKETLPSVASSVCTVNVPEPAVEVTVRSPELVAVIEVTITPLLSVSRRFSVTPPVALVAVVTVPTSRSTEPSVVPMPVEAVRLTEPVVVMSAISSLASRAFSSLIWPAVEVTVTVPPLPAVIASVSEMVLPAISVTSLAVVVMPVTPLKEPTLTSLASSIRISPDVVDSAAIRTAEMLTSMLPGVLKARFVPVIKWPPAPAVPSLIAEVVVLPVSRDRLLLPSKPRSRAPTTEIVPVTSDAPVSPITIAFGAAVVMVFNSAGVSPSVFASSVAPVPIWMLSAAAVGRRRTLAASEAMVPPESVILSAFTVITPSSV